MSRVCRRKSPSTRASSLPSASVARTPDASSTAYCARFLRSTPVRTGRPRQIRTARFPGITRVVGLQATVYHRGGQVQTAEGAPNRGFRWSHLCSVTCQGPEGRVSVEPTRPRRAAYGGEDRGWLRRLSAFA